MQVNVEEVSPCRKKLVIEIPAEAVTEEYGEVLKQYTRFVQIQGFRKGKAPARLVRSRYAKEIREEVRDRLMPNGYQHALKQEKIRPVAILHVDESDLKEGNAYAYTITCDVPPEFDLPAYKSIQLEGKSQEVRDEDVESALDRIREQHASYNEVDRPVEEGDLVQVNFTGRCDGQPLEEKVPDATGLGKGEEFWVMAEEKAFLPGFSEGLKGHVPGDKVTIDVEFPDDFPRESLRGLKAVYDVELLLLREKTLPPVDDELAKKLGVESAEALRSVVKEDLERQLSQGEQRRLKGELVGKLLERTNLDLPESVVQDETRNAVYQMVREITARGTSDAEVQEHKEEIFETASKNAADKVKIRYILERIAEAEKIEVEESEFQESLQLMAMRQGVELEQFNAYLKEKNMVENIREDIRSEKTMDFLLEQAEIIQ